MTTATAEKAKTPIKDKQKAPEDVLIKGNDPRLPPVRNNLVRKLPEILEALKSCSDEIALKIQREFNPNEMVTASQTLSKALDVRCSSIKPPVEAKN